MDKELEIMRILRVPPKGELVVEVNGNRYQSLTDLKNPKNRQLILTAVGELITFTGGYQALVDAGVAASPMTQGTQKSLEEQRAEFLAKMQGGTSVSREPVSSVIPEETTDLPIVEQIDNILQKYINQDPNLQHRSIHLIDNPNGNGIQIKIDGQIYTHPKKIEDKRIQLTIKQAIKEWESK